MIRPLCVCVCVCVCVLTNEGLTWRDDRRPIDWNGPFVQWRPFDRFVVVVVVVLVALLLKLDLVLVSLVDWLFRFPRKLGKRTKKTSLLFFVDRRPPYLIWLIEKREINNNKKRPAVVPFFYSFFLLWSSFPSLLPSSSPFLCILFDHSGVLFFKWIYFCCQVQFSILCCFFFRSPHAALLSCRNLWGRRRRRWKISERENERKEERKRERKKERKGAERDRDGNKSDTCGWAKSDSTDTNEEKNIKERKKTGLTIGLLYGFPRKKPGKTK